MSDLLLRQNEACADDPYLLWDSIWNLGAGIADHALAGAAAGNAGGLVAAQGLTTAVILCLFTDRRVPANHPLADLAGDDPRGWWGDGVDVRADLGEAELGSLLWLLDRADLTTAVRWAPQLATEALSSLQKQGAVVRIDCSATTNEIDSLTLTVNLYGQDGAKMFSQQFDLLWQQTRT